MREYISYYEFTQRIAKYGFTDENITEGYIDEEPAYLVKENGCLYCCWIQESGEYREF